MVLSGVETLTSIAQTGSVGDMERFVCEERILQN